MITQNDAIAIAKAIATAAKIEIDQYCSVNYDPVKVPAIRGTTFRALDEIWYDVIPSSTRIKFMEPGFSGGSREAFLSIAREILDKD